MSILEAAPPPEVDLAQGDLLKNVPLFVTASDGEPEVEQNCHALVLSRDCVALHKGKVVAATVRVSQLEFPAPEDATFGSVLDLLTAIRDGDGTPDRFYLGSLPGSSTGRLMAHLDELVTIKLPEDEAAKRAWWSERRVARLNHDFIRALPVRVFQSLARVGFDDVEWLPTPDLDQLLHAGNAELAKLMSGLGNRRYELGALPSDASPKQKAGLETGLRKAEEAEARFRTRLDSYRRERDRRR
ncbi:MAG: hypothetical protein WCJ30_19265 [Deltaproteobacteria bacterium]